MSAPAEQPPSTYLISDHNRWPRIPEIRQGEIRRWLMLNGISLTDICLTWPLSVTCGTGDTWWIHHWVYRKDAAGCRRTDRSGEFLVEERFTPMEIDPPMYWMQ